MEDIAITGLGVISSIGHNVDEFCQNLSAGHVAAGPTPWNNEDGLENVWMSKVENFQAEDWMDSRVADGTDPFAQYAIAAAVQAVESCGIKDFDDERTAVVIGTSCAGTEVIANSQRGLDLEGPSGVDRKLQIKAWPNMAAGQIAQRWKLHGPLLTVSTACASSIDAIGTAARLIERGDCDVAIAGGCDASRTQVTLIAAGRYGMLSPQPDPYKACRPFNTERFGIMGGEGAGVIILERADLAKARGAKIYGYLRGYASLSDGYHPSSSNPDGSWEARTMEKAIEDAGLPGGTDDVDALIAHGTGTPLGDIAEIKAINQLFGGREKALKVSSIKGHVGHTAGAAGVMGLMAALHSMEEGAMVPTAGTTDVDPAADFDVVIQKPSKGELKTMQVNGFGFGGQNASLVVSRN
ncbi:MAG: beta-ketoacyl-[acyl-carrier-protein] synthase family protein [Rhodospirillaceae bacterium]|jgi:3-oxoacyl-[acyl-carrier-protein] synthase II|nr:beta-ketoacyl-[acyl-carrier-protein] synthase family protein [Rhodospirillaceae bacterium]MBT3494623.1 beta-ketoacyl-[acyl-carrier-protein] synthase family protein [Rhodospirillaceae bacterium]MBT3780887.1 beta-ketoacyl-[acyl-carrier-protein] synthase family protein [Rhodospirillaceae bacterium]MBT3978912.1 beta-ketoacyl-[acyl-carrier-protein] synthase family protein [Rhodospirillaceae bacterium]MBT4170827.1 beta-ketoacyl-[acyl-carrier-protein] synthase family protein [Rhodospirillaceae bact